MASCGPKVRSARRREDRCRSRGSVGSGVLGQSPAQALWQRPLRHPQYEEPGEAHTEHAAVAGLFPEPPLHGRLRIDGSGQRSLYRRCDRTVRQSDRRRGEAPSERAISVHLSGRSRTRSMVSRGSVGRQYIVTKGQLCSTSRNRRFEPETGTVGIVEETVRTILSTQQDQIFTDDGSKVRSFQGPAAFFLVRLLLDKDDDGSSVVSGVATVARNCQVPATVSSASQSTTVRRASASSAPAA